MVKEGLTVSTVASISAVTSVSAIAESAGVAKAAAVAQAVVAVGAVAKAAVAQASETTLLGLLSFFRADGGQGEGSYDLKVKLDFSYLYYKISSII